MTTNPDPTPPPTEPAPSPRPVEEIDLASLVRRVQSLPTAAAELVAREFIADRLAAADRENAELRGEVERLRGVMHDWAGEMGSAVGRIERLEARSAQLERVEWLIDHADAFTGPHIHVDSLRAALSAAPQPEPERQSPEPDSRRWGGSMRPMPDPYRNATPEPPASDEPARCVHGETEPHATSCFCPAGAPCEHDCPGPTCHGTGSAAGGGL